MNQDKSVFGIAARDDKRALGGLWNTPRAA